MGKTKGGKIAETCMKLKEFQKIAEKMKTKDVLIYEVANEYEKVVPTIHHIVIMLRTIA